MSKYGFQLLKFDFLTSYARMSVELNLSSNHLQSSDLSACLLNI